MVAPDRQGVPAKPASQGPLQGNLRQRHRGRAPPGAGSALGRASSTVAGSGAPHEAGFVGTVGLPRGKRKGRAPDRCPFGTGVIRVEPDRRHVTLAKIGTVRTCERPCRRERLVRLGRARILAATLNRVGERSGGLAGRAPAAAGVPHEGSPSEHAPMGSPGWPRGDPVRPGPPGHAAGKREAHEGNPVRGAA